MAIKRKLFYNFSAFLIAAAIYITPVMAAEVPEELVPMGNTVGIAVETDGVVVANIVEVTTEDGTRSPARDAGICPGDIITHIGADKINGMDDLQAVLGKNSGELMNVRILRDGQEKQTEICPCKSCKGVYELGVWLRDSMTGLGTITFYDPDSKTYGGLGHPINDIDTGIILPVRTGSIMQAAVSGVIRGEPGDPGQLQGEFDADNVLGDVKINTDCGIFGELSEIETAAGKDTLPVAKAEEIKLGEAVILSSVSGEETKSYTAEIIRLYTDFSEHGRNMMIKITDEDLIELTGGIVQGMSGSPIIQDGKIIGAVTHVLVNDPTRGYGITIENMLEAAA